LIRVIKYCTRKAFFTIKFFCEFVLAVTVMHVAVLHRKVSNIIVRTIRYTLRMRRMYRIEYLIMRCSYYVVIIFNLYSSFFPFNNHARLYI
jgi:hypothetical protein